MQNCKNDHQILLFIDLIIKKIGEFVQRNRSKITEPCNESYGSVLN